MWDINTKYLQKGETIEYSDRPSLKTIDCIICYIWMAITLIPGSFFVMAALLAEQPNRVAKLMTIYLASTLPAILTLPAIYFIINRMATRYAISNKGIFLRNGVITTNIKKVPFEHITSLEFRKTIVGKILGDSTLLIDTSGSGMYTEVKWKHLKAPHKVKNLIESHIVPQE